MPDQRNFWSKYCFLTIAVLMCLCIFPLYPQEGHIISIEVIGLKRTKPHIAHYPLEKFIGREASSLDLNEIEAVIKDTGIMELVKTELVEAENGLILRLTIEEKWAIFPFPLIMAGSGRYSFGFFLADMNAFGLRDQAAFGGIYSSSGWMAMAMYNHTPNRKGQFGWNSIFFFSRQEEEDEDKNQRVHRQYTADQLRFSFGVFYPFSDHITGSATASFSNITLQNNNKALNPPKNGAMLLGISPGFSLRYSDWDGYLLSQQSLSLTYQYNFAITGSSYQQTYLKAVYEKSLIPGFRLNLRSGVVWKSGRDPLNEESPQRAQIDILPWKYSARNYAGFSAGLEKHLFNTGPGVLSALFSWQCVFSNGLISGSEFNNGPSGGIRFYLSRLALPAMGANIAYNMNSGLVQLSFNVGMEF